ncbi:penicillin-binding protein activator [Acidithiobacillus sp. AMEEHan]|uniref:penicillin-binding protein activator n=1 Tax=Acidithiobacillus sp. AMEEHan TaxID=2994951 RepID=UPI0027E4054E|nr:penicillin-binding protein activator [Acidithiobacillus sp. AMEEHan]
MQQLSRLFAPAWWRLGSTALLTVLLGACASMPHTPAPTPAPAAVTVAPAPVEISQAQKADRLLAEGKDLAAAKEYIQAAAASGADQQLDYLLKAAQASLDGNRTQVASLLSAEVLRLSQDPSQRAKALWIQAQAYQRDGQDKLASGALAELISISSVSPEQRATAMKELAEIYQRENHDLTALDFLVKRDALLSGAAKTENRRQIHSLLDAQSSAKLKNWQGRSGDPIVQEWLAFALIAREHVEPAARDAAFAAWLQAHPGHPDIHYGHTAAPPAGGAKGAICTLLPTTGRFADNTLAFTAGLQAAAQQVSGPAIHELSDSSDPALNATQYAAGVQAGCAAFVGPVLPQDINAVLGARHPQDPPILLLGDVASDPSKGIYDFDISLQVVARRVAEDAFRAGYRQAAVLYPLDAEGAAMQAAFLENWKRLGGNVAGVAHYRVGSGDTAGVVQEALGSAGGRGAFTFLVTSEKNPAAIITDIRAHSSSPILLAGIPTFTSEDSGGLSGSKIYALGMPWVFDPQMADGPAAQAVKQSLPQATAQQWRMAGLGVEAYGLLAKILGSTASAERESMQSMGLSERPMQHGKRNLRWVTWQKNGAMQVLPQLPRP